MMPARWRSDSVQLPASRCECVAVVRSDAAVRFAPVDGCNGSVSQVHCWRELQPTCAPRWVSTVRSSVSAEGPVLGVHRSFSPRAVQWLLSEAAAADPP